MQKCRSILGTDCNLTDAQLEQLRQELYAFADVAVGAFCAFRKPGVYPENGSCLDVIPVHERDAVAERAAILEFDANLKKPEAERQAFGEWALSKKPLSGGLDRRAVTKSRKPNRIDSQSEI